MKTINQAKKRKFLNYFLTKTYVEETILALFCSTFVVFIFLAAITKTEIKNIAFLLNIN